jgi:hyperosmotically inducible periplasmic protein
MRQFAAFLILVSLFVLLVGTRFKPSDGDKLASVSRVALGRIRESLPPAAKMAGPLQLLRREIPERLEDKVKARLEADSRLDGVTFDVTANGADVTIRGVLPSAKSRRTAVSIAEHTTGVNAVVDELAAPE